MHGWSRDGAEQALSILLAAAVVLAMVQLLRSNRALVQAREELADLAVHDIQSARHGGTVGERISPTRGSTSFLWTTDAQVHPPG